MFLCTSKSYYERKPVYTYTYFYILSTVKRLLFLFWNWQSVTDVIALTMIIT